MLEYFYSQARVLPGPCRTIALRLDADHAEEWYSSIAKNTAVRPIYGTSALLILHPLPFALLKFHMHFLPSSRVYISKGE